MSNVIYMQSHRERRRVFPFKKPLVVYSKLDFHDWMFYNVNGYKELKLRMDWAELKISREIERIKNTAREKEAALIAEQEMVQGEIADEIRTLTIDFLKKNGYDGIVFEKYLYPPFCDDNELAKRAFFYL